MIRRGLVAAGLLCASLLAPANGLISPEAQNVVRGLPLSNSNPRGKQLATLQSYLLKDPVTVGVAPGESNEPWKKQAIANGISVWADAIPDSPFVLAKDGEKPMIVVRFVRGIGASGDVQGQVEATRYLRWGSNTVSYRIEATLQVKMTTGQRNLQDDEVTEVIAHELGHVLGLDDNPECVGLMGPFVPDHARPAPSREEIRAVMQYRDQLRDAIAKASNSR